MKDFDEFKFNRLEERAWELEKMLKENEIVNNDENQNGWDREICRSCLSGEMQIFCEVCHYR